MCIWAQRDPNISEGWSGITYCRQGCHFLSNQKEAYGSLFQYGVLAPLRLLSCLRPGPGPLVPSTYLWRTKNWDEMVSFTLRKCFGSTSSLKTNSSKYLFSWVTKASCVRTETNTSHSPNWKILKISWLLGRSPHTSEVLGGRAQLHFVPIWELAQGLATALTPNPSSLLLGYISPWTTKHNTGQGP